MFDNPINVWLTLVCIFLLIEAFTVSFFFLLWSMAAIAMLFVVAFAPEMGWDIQILLFCLFSGASLYLWNEKVRKWQSENSQGNMESELLNHTVLSLIGREFILDNPISQQYGQLSVDGSIWRVHCNQDLAPGERVVVQRIEGNLLHVASV